MHYDGRSILHSPLPRELRDHGWNAGRSHCIGYDADGYIHHGAVRDDLSSLYAVNTYKREKEGIRALQHTRHEQIQPGKGPYSRDDHYMGGRAGRRSGRRHRPFQTGGTGIYEDDRNSGEVYFFSPCRFSDDDDRDVHRYLCAHISQFDQADRSCEPYRACDGRQSRRKTTEIELGCRMPWNCLSRSRLLHCAQDRAADGGAHVVLCSRDTDHDRHVSAADRRLGDTVQDAAEE